MARVFAVQAQVSWDIRVSWVVKQLEGCEVVMVFQNCLGCKAQCRAEGPDRSAASVRGRKILLRAVRESGCSSHS